MTRLAIPVFGLLLGLSLGCGDRKSPQPGPAPKPGPSPTPTPGPGPAPSTGPAELAWTLDARTLTYTVQGPVGDPVDAVLELQQGGSGTLKIGSDPAFEVTLSAGGDLVPKESTNQVPVYLDALRIASQAKAPVSKGDTFEYDEPADGDIPDMQLTVQSRVSVEVQAVTGDEATLSYGAQYRVVDNPGLKAFIGDVFGGSPDPATTKLIEDAKDWRLASTGTLVWNVADGALTTATVTGAGLPLESLTASELAASSSAFTYTLTRK